MKTTAPLLDRTRTILKIRSSDLIFLTIFAALFLVSSLLLETFFTSSPSPSPMR